MTTVSRVILWVVGILIIAVWLQLGWWLWYPYEVIVVERPIRVMNYDKKVMVGGVLFYKIVFEKKMNVTGTLTRKLVNDFKLDLADSIVTAPVGADKDIVPIRIPRHAEPGKYHLWWSVEYKVNPIRTVTVSVESEMFEIISGGLNEGPKGDTGATGKTGPPGEGFSIFGGKQGKPGKDCKGKDCK